MSAVTEELFNKLNTHKGVEGIILADADGFAIKSTFTDEQTTYFYSTRASMFMKKCKKKASAFI